MSGEPVAVLVAAGPRSDRGELERFELALALVSYEFAVRVLFTGDGIWHLFGQQESAPAERAFTRGWASLPTLGSADLLVDGGALTERGLRATLVRPPFAVVTAEEWKAVLRESPWVL